MLCRKCGIFKFWFCQNGVCPNVFPVFSSAMRRPLPVFASCWKPFPWEKMVSIGRYYHGKHCHIMAIIAKIGSTSGSFMVYITRQRMARKRWNFNVRNTSVNHDFLVSVQITSHLIWFWILDMSISEMTYHYNRKQK